ncbi:MAG: alanine racemase [Phycisphaerae bacterium]|nr:alanine racemase [Phycisphaerae bacterium]
MHSDLIAQINIDRLVHNYRVLRRMCRPGVRICAVLKADAYGHGIRIVAPALQAAGADYAAVATLHEALELRSANWHSPILMLGNVLTVVDERERRERLRAIVKHKLTLTITDRDTIKTLARMDLQSPIDVHIKVDTGMGRMGALPDAIADLVESVRGAGTLRLVGIYSHFATADSEERDLAEKQLATMNGVVSRLWPDPLRLGEDCGHSARGGVIRHFANSAATITMPESHLDMVRPGLVLYGHVPADHMADRLDLRPILRLVSHLTLVKDLPAGHCVGYGQTFTTPRPTRLGIVPIGYCDGYLRSLSNSATVGTAVGDAPVIGRVSMDQLAVDLTDLPPLMPGAEVVLIDDKPDRPNSVPAIARQLGTIPYEVLCLLGQRIQRVPVGDSCATRSPSADRRSRGPNLRPVPGRKQPAAVAPSHVARVV